MLSALGHLLLKALHAFLQLLKLPRGFLHTVLLRLEGVFSKIRRVFSTLRCRASKPEDPSHDVDFTSDVNTDNDLKPGLRGAEFTTPSHVHTFVPGYTTDTVCASTVPSNTVVAGRSRGRYPPTRQRSLSYPDIRQTFTPATATMLSPRPRSIHSPLPIADLPVCLMPTDSSATLSVAGINAFDLARTRAEFIEADSRSERRVSRSRAPGRSALGGQTRSRAGQPSSRLSSLTRSRSPSPMPQYPPSRPGSRVSMALSTSDISYLDTRHGADTHIQGSMAQAATDSPPPSIQLELEPPSPEQDRRQRVNTRDTMELNVESPSTESLPSLSAPSKPYSLRSHPSFDDDPTSVSTAGGSGDLRTLGRSFSPSSSMHVLPDGRDLREITPLEGPRYIRQGFLEDGRPVLELPRACLKFPHSPEWLDADLRGWEPITHSEGCLYFYHREKRIFTDAYVYLPHYMDEVEALAEHLERLSQLPMETPLPHDCELVVQITFDEWDGQKTVSWQYYYVHHETRSLFWLRPFQAGAYLEEITGPVSPAHFKHMLETWYWDHISLFPTSFRSHGRLVQELVGDLTFFCIDYMTSPTTTIPYPLAELKDMIQLLGGREPGAGATAIAAALGRIMSVFCHWRYIHFHGQRYARMDRHESIRDSPAIRPRTWLMKIFSWLFLSAPEVHLSEIEKLYVDGIIVMYIWKRHITKLQDEWQELITYATIILTASVSLLSVPDVILFPLQPDGQQGGGTNVQNYTKPLRSPAAIASYISILCSTGSIVLGLMLVRQHRTKNHDFADEASAYMEQQDRPYFHHEPLAILYSLPYALLMWAMLSFLASVMIFTLVKTDIATQSTIAGVSLVVSALIVWCAAAAWDRDALRMHLWHAVRYLISLGQGDARKGRDEASHDTSTLTDKSGTLPRMHSRSLAERMRGARIHRVNEV